ncbi:MAG: SdpI family protein [Clostridiales bacterium]
MYQRAKTADLFLALIYYGTSLLFIVIGNYLPKIKQNNTIGIRIVLTLQDEENLNATHSFSGRIWRASGILCMLCTLHLIKSVSKEACIKAK